MTRAQKNKLIEKYMTNDIPELTDFQRDWIKRNTAHYIFVNKDEDGNQKFHCDSCDQDVELGKTKHKAKVVCPSCGKEMQIMHTWRFSRVDDIDWIAIPMVLNDDTFMLRYVLVMRSNNTVTHLDECARMVYKFNRPTVYHFEKYEGNWDHTTAHYFREYGMGYQERKICCLRPQPYKPTFVTELRKLKGLEYLPDGIENVDYSSMPLHWAIDWMKDRIDLYEKMCKAGLAELAGYDIENLCNRYGEAKMAIKYQTKESSLVKMLGINKSQLRFLRDHQSLTVYKLIHSLSEDELDLVYKSNVYIDDVSGIKRRHLNMRKSLKYLTEQKCTATEWFHYLNVIESLRYNMDDPSYVYPKSFRKADKRVSAELVERQRIEREKADARRLKQLSERDSLIAKISDALRENYRIREFFSGSNGLQVYVPESAEELYNAGKDLHNCLGTYVDRVAEGKTLIFFVRRIEDPTAPYVALEYCHGRIVQCRYDHNRSVDDPKVIEFTEALAARLREANILAA